MAAPQQSAQQVAVWQVEEPRRDAVGSGTGVNSILSSPLKTPRWGGSRWCTQKRRRNPGSMRRSRQRLRTAEARGREDGWGGRQRRISPSMSSSSMGEVPRRRIIARWRSSMWGPMEASIYYTELEASFYFFLFFSRMRIRRRRSTGVGGGRGRTG